MPTEIIVIAIIAWIVLGIVIVRQIMKREGE